MEDKTPTRKTLLGMSSREYDVAATAYSKSAIVIWLVVGFIYIAVSGVQRLFRFTTVIFVIPGIFVASCTRRRPLVLDWYSWRVRQARRLTIHWCGRLLAPHNSDVGRPCQAPSPTGLAVPVPAYRARPQSPCAPRAH